MFQKEVIDPVKENDGRLITDGTMDDVLKQKAMRMTLDGKNCSVPGHKEILRKMTWTPENHVDGIRKRELCPAEGKNLIYRMEDDRGVHEIHAGLDHCCLLYTSREGMHDMRNLCCIRSIISFKYHVSMSRDHDPMDLGICFFTGIQKINNIFRIHSFC